MKGGTKMKKLVFMGFVLTFANLSYGGINPEEIFVSVSAKLHDGRSIDIKKEVEGVSFRDFQIDYCSAHLIFSLFAPEYAPISLLSK